MARRRTREPRWLSRVVVDAIQTEQIREHGGLPGIRDENVLESALARPRQKWTYGVRDIAVIAAAYAFGFIRNHPYRDGNKRIGFLAAATFLGLNDHDLDVTDADVVANTLGLAAGEIDEDDYADWIRRTLKNVV